MTPKALKQKKKDNLIHKGYGKWDYILSDKPVRKREFIMHEAVVKSSPKTGAKFAGNQ